MARGTSADATRHARPHGRAARAHAARRCAQVTRTRGRSHASPRGCPGGDMWQGGWQVKGPRVSGPWLEYWGGNAIALNRPSFYTRDFHSFPQCGTKFPGDFLLQATWRHRGCLMRSWGVNHVDPSPRDRN